MDQSRNESGITRGINKGIRIFHKIGMWKQALNRRMEGKYSPTLIAIGTAFFAMLFMIIMLFLPNFLGVAGDQSVVRVMHGAGVYHTQTQETDIYNNYFVRTYSNVLVGQSVDDTFFNSQVAFVRLAVWLDNMFTRDRIFDIRFLAFLYAVFYVPAIYLLIKQACNRVTTFSEGIAVGILGLLMFSDVAYITFFNSFYPEALLFICVMYIVAAGLSFQNNRTAVSDFGSLLIIALAGMILAASRGQNAILGILIALFCLKLLFARKNWMWGVICVLTAFWLSLWSIICMINLESDFDDVSRLHSMTRGVLFEAGDPAKALKEFGIDSSYELLADTSTYTVLPVVKADEPLLKAEFLDKYTYRDITAYYVRHPGSFVNLLDLSIKSCFGIRREYCGNYEKSVGLPAGAKSPMFSLWSTFKTSTAPKTIGYLLVLIAAVILLFYKGYSIRSYEERRNIVYMDMLFIIILIIMVQASVTIVGSGDAEMVHHCFLVSYGIDLITYFVAAELVHKINIF